MAINNESSRKGLCQLTFRSYKKSLDKLLSVENKSMTSHCLKRYRILSLIPSKKRENNWKLFVENCLEICSNFFQFSKKLIQFIPDHISTFVRKCISKKTDECYLHFL